MDCKILIKHERAMKTGYTAPTLPVCGNYGEGTKCNYLNPCSHQVEDESSDIESIRRQMKGVWVHEEFKNKPKKEID